MTHQFSHRLRQFLMMLKSFNLLVTWPPVRMPAEMILFVAPVTVRLIDFSTTEREEKGALVTAAQAQEAQEKAAAEGIAFDSALMALDYLSEEALVSALTQECWVPHLKVDRYEIRKKALDTIGEQDARYYSVLPVDKLGGILNLAMVNPLDQDTINALEQKIWS